jgi:hypothetical protein
MHPGDAISPCDPAWYPGRDFTHHIDGMAKEHPHAAASYRVVPQKDFTFGVEVIVPGSFPALVTSFATEQIAEAWITDYKRRVGENAPPGFMRRNSRT